MKKNIVILSIALVAISFASCKKDRTCTCVVNAGSPGAQDETTIITLKKVTKSTAKEACVSADYLPSGQPYTEKHTCTLK